MKFKTGESVTVITQGSEEEAEAMVINTTDNGEYIISIPAQMLKVNKEKRLIQQSILKVAEKWLRPRQQEHSTQHQG